MAVFYRRFRLLLTPSARRTGWRRQVASGDLHGRCFPKNHSRARDLVRRSPGFAVSIGPSRDFGRFRPAGLCRGGDRRLVSTGRHKNHAYKRPGFPVRRCLGADIVFPKKKNHGWAGSRPLASGCAWRPACHFATIPEHPGGDARATQLPRSTWLSVKISIPVRTRPFGRSAPTPPTTIENIDYRRPRDDPRPRPRTMPMSPIVTRIRKIYARVLAAPLTNPMPGAIPLALRRDLAALAFATDRRL